MARLEEYRDRFRNRAHDADTETVLGDAAAYQVNVQAADVPAGQTYWRAIGVHHLTPEENQGKHAVYVEIIDAEGEQRTRPQPKTALGLGRPAQR